MVPPGHPGLHEPRANGRARHATRSRGRAWSGLAPVARVDVSVDGGATLGRRRRSSRPSSATGPGAASATSGRRTSPAARVLCCRARDEAGNEQPLETPWNVGGYANNAVQRVAVTVRLAARSAPVERLVSSRFCADLLKFRRVRPTTVTHVHCSSTHRRTSSRGRPSRAGHAPTSRHSTKTKQPPSSCGECGSFWHAASSRSTRCGSRRSSTRLSSNARSSWRAPQAEALQSRITR